MNGIEHGTLRGWRQHKRRGIPACGPCAEARRQDNETQADDATQHARQQWNRGQTGTGRPAASTPVVETCTVTGCGSTADKPRRDASMVSVLVPGSSEPARWYCPGRCAAIGRALADLRSVA